MRPIFAVAALVALAAACSGDSPTNPSPNIQPTSSFVLLNRGRMTATVDGVAWEAAATGATTSSKIPSTSIATMSALEPGSTQLLSLTVPLTVGTHHIDGPTLVTFSLIQRLGVTTWSASPFTNGSTGLVTVTAASQTHVAGTFAFIAVATAAGTTPERRVVALGTFDLSQ